MKPLLNATVWQEGNWHVARCLEVDVASLGKAEAEALANLREALDLHFEEPRATIVLQVSRIEVDVGAA